MSNRKAKKLQARGLRIQQEAQKVFEQKCSKKRNTRTNKTSLQLADVWIGYEIREIDNFMLLCAY